MSTREMVPFDAPFVVDHDANLALVFYMVDKMGVWPDEEYQEVVNIAYAGHRGRGGYRRACQLFDPSKGIQFSTYACRAISNAVIVWRRNRRLHRRCWAQMPEQADRYIGTTPRTAFDDEIDREDTEARHRRVVAMLDDREREILERRVAGETLDAVGARFGLTKERVRQIELTAINRVRVEHGLAAQPRGSRSTKARNNTRHTIRAKPGPKARAVA